MLPYPWRLSIGAARLALGIGSFVLQIGFTGRASPWGLPAILAFVAYAAYAMRGSIRSGGWPLVTLSIDMAAFLSWLLLTGHAGFSGPVWMSATLTMYVFLLSCAALTEGWRAPAIAVVCLTAAAADPGTRPLLQAMIFASLLASIWVLDRRRLDSRLGRASRQSVLYRFEAQHSREDERQRISADFHDGPLQSFIGLQMRLEIVKKMLARDARMAAEELRQLQDLCKSQVGELRAFLRSMRPADVDGASLGASLSRMVGQFQKDTGISTSFLSTACLDPADPEISLEVLQIVREALNNVQKHARASRVAVALNRNGDYLEISVDDNGSGFPFSGSYTLEELELLRLGPLSIRRRVRALRGELNVDSRPGQGAGLKVRVAV